MFLQRCARDARFRTGITVRAMSRSARWESRNVVQSAAWNARRARAREMRSPLCGSRSSTSGAHDRSNASQLATDRLAPRTERLIRTCPGNRQISSFIPSARQLLSTRDATAEKSRNATSSSSPYRRPVARHSAYRLR